LKNDQKVDFVTVYDITGAIVFTQAETSSVPVSSLSEGMYFVEVLSGNSRGVKRIVVQK
jgi:hypothetical protein